MIILERLAVREKQLISWWERTLASIGLERQRPLCVTVSGEAGEIVQKRIEPNEWDSITLRLRASGNGSVTIVFWHCGDNLDEEQGGDVG